MRATGTAAVGSVVIHIRKLFWTRSGLMAVASVARRAMQAGARCAFSSITHLP